MKTTLATLIVALITIATAIATPRIELRATSAKTGGLTEAQVRSGSQVSVVSKSEADSIVSPAFGYEATVWDGDEKINATWSSFSMTHTIYVNGGIATDTAGNPIENRSHGAFNAIGSATPDIRGLNKDMAQSVPTGTATSGVTLNGTHSVILSNFAVAITGTTRRPFLDEYGSYYGIKFTIGATINGTVVPAKSIMTMVMVGRGGVWLDLNSDGQWANGGDWIDGRHSGEGNSNLVLTVRTSTPGTGREAVLIGVETATDLQNWSLWDETDGSVIFTQSSSSASFELVSAGDDSRRQFRARYAFADPPSP